MNLGIAELVFLFGIVVLCALTGTLVAGVGLAISRRRAAADAKPATLEFIRSQYARGEISQEQFDRMSRDLS
jgi:uncharacterized membrane protein